ncbi:MAG: O-linked N-acetylglucosamine transferase, SPINDLY family protein [Calothrix sp. MO_167.B12]|nr:O-linked N-acetylglucosamine transferase, SPINDLY family protein [Calothrix sp. MO_167.B12]
MTAVTSYLDKNLYEQKIEQYLTAGDYGEIAKIYEEAIKIEPDIKSHYWHLGLMLLLQGQETEAQMTWFMALTETDDQELYTLELLEVLQTEAERRVDIEDYQVAWFIRQHIREISPQNINNLLHIINLQINYPFFEEEFNLSEIINLLKDPENNYSEDLLLEVLTNILASVPEKPSVLAFVEACLVYFPRSLEIVDLVGRESLKIAYFKQSPDLASRFAELCLHYFPNHREVLIQLASFYQNSQEYYKGIETAKRCYEVVETVAEKTFANSLILRGLMTSGSYWQEACASLKQQEILARQLIEEQPINLDTATTVRLFNSVFFLPYFSDNPQNHHFIQNQISCISHQNVINHHPQLAEKHSQKLLTRHKNRNTDKKHLNIGYISHCFKRHSVSWLCRWMFQHHNPEKFKIHGYFLHDSNQLEGFTKHFFADKVDKFYNFGIFDKQILDQIQEDEIDILVDLDSITLDASCELLSIKSAPIQVTWLGWDASGLPTIDYFIADPYVLPESAQDYYSETIWRLPQTYIAVDGFELDVPDLRRDQLDIPSDAIVYFMTQKGYKRHLEHLRLQMRIIKEVPNSYLLIKGQADPEASKEFFEQIAQETGVDYSRLRFLPPARSEAVHRANLGIADVVLDTFPYNGATTTLETLWMSIPMVTRVGQQFAARNSYTMMVNAGITEGIAWTEDEYVEWGVRLGKDEKLRQEISWKLRQGRQTAPLWNAKQFTRDMEKAYEQMWQRYVEE